MLTHITTAEARAKGLPGHDVYKYSHLLYHDDLNRDAGVVRLNVEALKAFSDTVMLAQRHQIAREQAAVKEWLNEGGFAADLPYPWGEASVLAMEYANYENLKLASGFELHLKARLLARNYVVHKVDTKVPGCRDLAKEQDNRPISKHELFAVQQYHFDGRQNYLPGLKETSLRFSCLTDQPHYRAALALPSQHLDVICDFRSLRNQIHFPGDIVEAPNMQNYPGPIVEFVTTFINAEIIEWTNDLIAKHKLNFRPLQRIE